MAARDEHAEIGRSAGKIGVGTALSHVFGLIRDVIFAFLFGTSLYADAFNLAFSVPTFFRRLFGEGVMNAAFVPIFTQHRIAKGKEESNRFGSNALIVLGLLLLLSVGAGVVIAPWILRLYAAGWREDPERMAAAVRLTRILFPYLLLIGPAVLTMGILNALRHFTVPAFSPVFFNIGIITFALIAMRLPDRGFLRIDLFCVGVLVGSLGQLLSQLPILPRRGFHFRFHFDPRSPELSAVGALMLPGIVGLAVVQINIMVDTFFATLLAEGSVTALRMGNRVMLLPLAIFATAIASASLPTLSAQVAREGIDEAKQTLAYTLRLLFFLLLPSAVGLIVLGRPIVRLLFVRGAFDAGRSLDITATTLVFYSLGLFAYGGVKGVSQMFFSLRDTRTPVIVGAIAMGTNILFDLLLYRSLAVGGLAFATSLAGVVNFLLLLYLLVRRHGPIREGRLLGTWLRVFLCAIVMGGTVHVVSLLLEPTDPGPLSGQILHVVGAIAAGGVVYFAAATLLCRRELGDLKRALLLRRSLS
ncbi:MAG: murein biosynthesis integral membrane protein MurJ [Candidatus Eisenbacteria bacterium]|nr:murein biosynthesis integral membrane protein MurJ [Candidatus Eisenbacteria bacterium]